MTNNPSQTPVETLSEEALAEIEAQNKLNGHDVKDPVVAALCQSLRVAWASETILTDINQSLIDKNRAAHEILDALDITGKGELSVSERIALLNTALREQLALKSAQYDDAEVHNKGLREQWNTRFNTLCGNCGKRYLGPRDERLHGLGKCEELP